MNPTTLKAWSGQVTTGIGALIGCPAVIGLLTHQITLEQAIPLLIAAVIGLVFPENKSLATSAQTVATDAEVLIPQLLTAYRTGLTHGAAAVASMPMPPLPAAVIPAAPIPAP
jgi:hypothetical protein